MRKITIILSICIALVMVFMVVLPGCNNNTSTTTSTSSSTASTPKATIKIGMVSAFSGPFAASVPYWQTGLQLAINEVNASGGLLGSQVELITRDDQADPSTVVQKANELKQAGCVAIMGSLIEACNTALYKWSQTAKIPVMAPTSPEDTMRTTDFGKYGFFPTPNSSAWAAVAAKWLVDNNVKSVYVIGGDATIAHELHDSLWSTLNTIKPGAVADAGFTLRDLMNADWQSDFSTIISKKPEVLLAITGGPPYASFMQQAQQINLLSQVKVLGWEFLAPNNTTAFGKNFPQGIYSLNNCPFYLDTPEMKAFTQAYLALSKVYPDELGMPDYVGTKAFLQAIKQANSTDPDAIVSALETITIQTPVGPLTFNDYDHQPAFPIWVTKSTISPDYPIAIGTDLAKYQDGLYMTKDQVLAARKAK